MIKHSLFIDDDLVEASPMLERMRRDGLDRAWVPFAERQFLAWRGAPAPNLDAETLVNVLKVSLKSLPTPASLCAQHYAAGGNVSEPGCQLKHCCSLSSCAPVLSARVPAA